MTSGFSLVIEYTKSAFLFEFPILFHCMIFVHEMLKYWICGDRLIGLCFYVCGLLIFFLSIAPVAVGQYSRLVFFFVSEVLEKKFASHLCPH